MWVFRVDCGLYVMCVGVLFELRNMSCMSKQLQDVYISHRLHSVQCRLLFNKRVMLCRINLSLQLPYILIINRMQQMQLIILSQFQHMLSLQSVMHNM